MRKQQIPIPANNPPSTRNMPKIAKPPPYKAPVSTDSVLHKTIISPMPEERSPTIVHYPEYRHRPCDADGNKADRAFLKSALSRVYATVAGQDSRIPLPKCSKATEPQTDRHDLAPSPARRICRIMSKIKFQSEGDMRRSTLLVQTLWSSGHIVFPYH